MFFKKCENMNVARYAKTDGLVSLIVFIVSIKNNLTSEFQLLNDVNVKCNLDYA